MPESTAAAGGLHATHALAARNAARGSVHDPRMEETSKGAAGGYHMHTLLQMRPVPLMRYSGGGVEHPWGARGTPLQNRAAGRRHHAHLCQPTKVLAPSCISLCLLSPTACVTFSVQLHK